MNRVHHILAVKGTKVHKIPSTECVLNAIKVMDEHRIGSLLVVEEDGTLCGLIAERDVLRCILHRPEQQLSEVPVCQIMTDEVIVCKPTDKIDSVRNLMKTKWVRHIPVVDDAGRLQGIVSIGDVNAFMIQEEELEISQLHDYIEGRVR